MTIIENDICVIGTFLNKLDGDMVTITTNNLETPKVQLENKGNFINDSYYLDTVTSGLKSGTEIKYNVFEESGKNITNKINLKNNVVVNGVAHTSLNLESNKKYIIESTAGGVTEKFAIGYDDAPIDKTAPTCYWTTSQTTYIKNKTYNADIICTDDVEIKTRKLNKDKIGSSSWYVSISKVSEPKVYNGGKKVQWTVTIEVGNVNISHQGNLILQEGAVVDNFLNKNISTSTGNISIKTK